MADRELREPAQTGFDLLVTDPDRYFEQAWKRAEESVDRQIEREQHGDGRRRAGFRRAEEHD